MSSTDESDDESEISFSGSNPSDLYNNVTYLTEKQPLVTKLLCNLHMDPRYAYFSLELSAAANLWLYFDNGELLRTVIDYTE